jgi:exopolysaccharide biosynthesis polyprenyl glycosylphosphotransferase
VGAVEQAAAHVPRLSRGNDARVRAGRRGRLVRRALLTADAAGLGLAFVASQLLFGLGRGGATAHNLGVAVLLFVLTLPVWLATAKVYKLYDRDEERTRHSTVDDLVGVLHLVTVGVWVFYLGTRLTMAPQPNLPKLAGFWALAILLLTGSRATARALCRRSDAYLQRTIVVGAGEIGQLVARKLLQHPEYGIDLVGFVDANPKERRGDVEHVPLLGTPDDLAELARRHEVERVVVAFSSDSPERTIDAVRSLEGRGLQIDIVPRLYELVRPNAALHDVEGLALLGLPAAKPFPFAEELKRALDVAIAAAALALTAPFFAYAALRIKRDSPGPVFFRQTRLGRDMREFTMLKFRTMYVDTDDSEHREYVRRTMSASALPNANGIYKLEREHSVTPVGRLLRRTSLDELPQLLNVLRGDMSLVGPRPCLRYETESFAPHHFERFLVPAGLTGLWQVTARAHSTFGEALDLDVTYARSWSLGLDLWLLLRTPLELLRRSATA